MMTDKAETVILIHGLWMGGFVLLPHQRWLRAEGFSVRRFSYPSWRLGLADNVRSLSSFVSETPGSVIHLVAHSLGGLVALKMLSQEHDARIHRVVLMGTPYEGCHCGFTLTANPVLAALVGHTFEDWFRLPRPALPPAVEIGIIAGTRPISFGRLIPGLKRPNDGLVAVDETRIAAAQDSIALDINHSGMLVSRACAVQITNFLRTGSFIHV
ncbi:MAG: alpha/beta fold hydrolase [Gallionella sp.]|nr:alpha/beta fold hydrolase [Gallionella sp.]